MSYQWFQNVRRYRASNGRFVASKTVRTEIDKTAKNFYSALYESTEKMLSDYTPAALDAWNKQTKSDLRAMHTAFAMIALGGREASQQFVLDNADVWRAAEIDLARQLRFFDDFTFELLTNPKSREGKRPFARAASYALAGYQTYENAVRVREAVSDSDEEKRVTQSGNICVTCSAQAALGWQPKGTLRRLGDSECKSNCRCYFVFRKSGSKTN